MQDHKIAGQRDQTRKIGHFTIRQLRSFTTRTNTHVVLGATAEERLVIVKTALPTNSVGSGPAELKLQVRQIRTLHTLLGSANPFPPILYFDGTTLILPYFSGGTLSQAARDNPKLFWSSFHDAVDLLFSTPASIVPLAPQGTAFLSEQIEKRLSRLFRILDTTHAGRSFRDTILSHEGAARRQLEVIEQWLRAGKFSQLEKILYPRRLALALHGDFVAENVVIAPAHTLAWSHNVAFIDPRGEVVWHGGLPWWDPIMDLASFVTFEEIVAPIEFDLGIYDSLSCLAHQEYCDPVTWLIPRYCTQVNSFSHWTENDQRWNERLTLSVLVRLLGYISISLAYGPPRGEVYAHKILLAFSRVFEHIENMIGKALL
jgi:hypothetical protein